MMFAYHASIILLFLLKELNLKKYTVTDPSKPLACIVQPCPFERISFTISEHSERSAATLRKRYHPPLPLFHPLFYKQQLPVNTPNAGRMAVHQACAFLCDTRRVRAIPGGLFYDNVPTGTNSERRGGRGHASPIDGWIFDYDGRRDVPYN